MAPYRPPVLENVADKHDALDWSTLPDELCDLNYRSTTALPRTAAAQTLFALMLVPVLTLPIIFLIERWLSTACASWFGASAALLLTAGIVVTQILRKQTARRIVPLAILPLIVWLLIISMPLHAAPALSVLLLLVFAVPLVAWLADTVATHGVYWMSAHLRIDHAAMLAWRADWCHRFRNLPVRQPRRDDVTAEERLLHERVLKVRRNYRGGFLCYLVGLLLTGAAVTATCQEEPHDRVGLVLSLALLAVLLLGSLLRNRHTPRGFQFAFSFLTHLAGYGRSAPSPPWGFQSPAGSIRRRLGSALFVLIVVCTSWLPLAQYYRGALDDQRLLADLSESSSLLAVWRKALQGDVAVAGRAVLHYALLIGSPGLFVYLSLCFLAGPALAAHYDALEAPGAYEQHPDWNWLDGYSERLRNSRNPKERDSVLVGRHPDFDYAVLAHTKLLFEHSHTLGATGVGKTALGLMSHGIQLIRRGDGAVVVLDCKGDPAFFQTVLLEARRQGRPVKWFTNQLCRSTYLFNPFDPDLYRTQSLQDIVGLMMNAMNLHFGSDYGRAWFTIANRILLKRALNETRPAAPGTRRQPWPRKFEEIQSFRELNEIILYLAADGKDYQSAQHLAFLVESLAEIEQLNLCPRHDRHHPALAHAITMNQVVRDKQVIYFYLVGAIDTQSVAEIGRLALYCLLNACIQHKERTGQAPRAYVLVDEAQALVAQNIQHVLDQARSHGLACFLAHQTLSQLNPPGGVDLRELVLGCTSVKQVFSARDPWLQKYLAEMSGRVRYAQYGYQQRASQLVRGRHGVNLALRDADWIRAAQVREVVAPRLGPQDFLDLNHNDNLCLLSLERAEAFSRWHGFAPVYLEWPMSEGEYCRRRDEIPWPVQDDQTLEVQPQWPAPENTTLLPPRQPDRQVNDERLRQLRRELEGE